MKVLGILGSPHKNGGSAQLLLAALKSAEKEGAKVKLLSLYEGDIKPCLGCLHNEEPECKYPCIFDDYGKIILKEIYEANGIIFATPIYWFAPSGPVKILIDRMTCLENMVAYGEPSYMEGKVVGAIAVGADEGGAWVGGYLITTFNCMGAIIPPWGIAYSHQSKKAIFDDKALMDAINVGILVTRLLKRLEGQKVELTYFYNKEFLENLRKEVLEELGKIEKVTRERDGKLTVKRSSI